MGDAVLAALYQNYEQGDVSHMLRDDLQAWYARVFWTRGGGGGGDGSCGDETAMLVRRMELARTSIGWKEKKKKRESQIKGL